MKSHHKPAHLTKYQVILKPCGERPAAASRTEKIKALRSNATQARKELIGWIEEHNMAGQVVDVSEPNAFNMVYVVSEPSAARKLANAPNVDSVSPAGEVTVDLVPSPR
jgi:hypothetical protein